MPTGFVKALSTDHLQLFASFENSGWGHSVDLSRAALPARKSKLKSLVKSPVVDVIKLFVEKI